MSSLSQLHLWRLVGNRIILTLHVSLKPEAAEGDQVRSSPKLHWYKKLRFHLILQMMISRRMKDFFHSQGIHSTTIQVRIHTHFPSTIRFKSEIWSESLNKDFGCMILSLSNNWSHLTLNQARVANWYTSKRFIRVVNRFRSAELLVKVSTGHSRKGSKWRTLWGVAMVSTLSD